LAVFFAAFLVLRDWAKPASWNSEGWYRAAVLEEAKAQPLIYGGISSLSPRQRNQACQSCHAKENKVLRKRKHKRLSCESCHGPVSDHAQGEKKVALAEIDRSNAQCRNCHSVQINRPQGFPQFSPKIDKHKKATRENLPCLKCHEAHDPTN
jgi:hypothetical protein